MSHARNQFEKKKGRRFAGSYGPPRKKGKAKAHRCNRQNVRIDVRREAFSTLLVGRIDFDKEDA